MRIKKSFTLRLGRFSRNSTPVNEVAPYTGEAENFFRSAADQYHRRLLKFVLSSIAGFSLSAISLLLPDFLMKWVAIPGIFFVALSLALFFSLPELQCPSCGKASDRGFGTFCPACGKAQLRVSRLWGTRCDACDRSMGSYKYRNYPIRYCTHCGILLHAQGV